MLNGTNDIVTHKSQYYRHTASLIIMKIEKQKNDISNKDMHTAQKA